MTVFRAPDLVPLWDRPPDFLPLRPPGGWHVWRFAEVRDELERVAATLPKEAAERRVALLSYPGLDAGTATDGLNAGIQMLLPGEAAAPHRHSPAALRVGLVGPRVTTTIDDQEVSLGPLDVALNPSGTWHGHRRTDERDQPSFWLDIVDLPLVASLGGVLFEPPGDTAGDLLDPPERPPSTVWFDWADVTDQLGDAGSHRYAEGAVLPTLAVTAHRVAPQTTLSLPARTCGAVLVMAEGSLSIDGGETVANHDLVAIRPWTPLTLTAPSGTDGASTAIVIDSAPALRRLGLYRESPTR